MQLRKAGAPLVKPVQLPLLSELISLTESKSHIQCFFRAGRLQEFHGSKSTSAQCSQGLDPDAVEVADPGTFCCQQHEKGLQVVLPSANVCCTPSVVIYVLPVKSIRSRVRDPRARVNSEDKAFSGTLDIELAKPRFQMGDHQQVIPEVQDS